MEFASTGRYASEEVQNGWKAITETAAKGHQPSFDKFSDLQSEKTLAWVERNNDLVRQRDSAKQKADKASQKATDARYLGVALQILGTIIVLMKDLPRPKPVAPTPTVATAIRLYGH